MKFLDLTGSNTKGETAPVLVNIADVSSFRAVEGGRVLISLISNPEYPIWVTESLNSIAEAMVDLGVEMLEQSE